MIPYNLSLYNAKSSFSANTTQLIHSFVVFCANIFITAESVYIMPFFPFPPSASSLSFNAIQFASTAFKVDFYPTEEGKERFLNSIKCQIDFYHVACRSGLENEMISWSKFLNCIFRSRRWNLLKFSLLTYFQRKFNKLMERKMSDKMEKSFKTTWEPTEIWSVCKSVPCNYDLRHFHAEVSSK